MSIKSKSVALALAVGLFARTAPARLLLPQNRVELSIPTSANAPYVWTPRTGIRIGNNRKLFYVSKARRRMAKESKRRNRTKR